MVYSFIEKNLKAIDSMSSNLRADPANQAKHDESYARILTVTDLKYMHPDVSSDLLEQGAFYNLSNSQLMTETASVR